MQKAKIAVHREFAHRLYCYFCFLYGESLQRDEVKWNRGAAWGYTLSFQLVSFITIQDYFAITISSVFLYFVKYLVNKFIIIRMLFS